MSTYKRPESILVVVANRDKQILCLLRTDDPTFWQSVTGSLLDNEQPIQAVWRELQEETGLQQEQGQLIDFQYKAYFDIYPQFKHRYAPGTVQNLEHVFGFILESKLPIQLSSEHTKYCWLSQQDAIKIVKSPSNKKAIEKLIQNIP